MDFEPNAGNPTIETLARQVAAVAGAVRPADVFRALLDAARFFAPRTAVFLFREGSWKGWSASGYSREALERLKRLELAAEDGVLDRLSRCESPDGIPLPPGERLPDFGQPPALETHAVPMRAGTRTIGMLLAERAGGEAPWCPSALGILAIAARLRLELDLARRKARSPASFPLADRPDAPPARQAQPEIAATSASPPETSITPWIEPALAPQESLRRNEARRFAKLVATDIRLYNEEAVVLGRRDRDLFRRLAEQIERGRETFDRRFPELGAPGQSLLHQAFVEILAGGDEDLLPVQDTGVSRQDPTGDT